MENRVVVLEDQMGDVKSMLKTLIEKIHTQSVSINDLSKQIGKKVTTGRVRRLISK
jgi:hypothetical protein